MTYDLPARFDARKSFYGKAKIRKQDNAITLISYATDIISYTGETFRILSGARSQTTNRHLKEFIAQMVGGVDNELYQWARLASKGEEFKIC